MMWWDMLDGISILLFVVTFLISLVLCRVKVSLIMTPFGYFVDSVVDRITLTFLDSGSVLIVMQRGVGQCDEIATGAERPVLKLLLLLLLGILVGVEGEAKALLAGPSSWTQQRAAHGSGTAYRASSWTARCWAWNPPQNMLILVRYLERLAWSAQVSSDSHVCRGLLQV